jgi:uncharacterized membrane protein YccF (DUF307 family)
MRTLGNILWYFPIFGFINAIFVFLIGTILTLTLIGAPIGLGLIQYSRFLLLPFSNSMVDSKDLKNYESNKLWESYGTIVKIIYLPLGLLFAFITVIQIAALFISIVGIPVAIILAKSLSTYLNPVSKKCVPIAVEKEIERRKNATDIDKYLDNQ